MAQQIPGKPRGNKSARLRVNTSLYAAFFAISGTYSLPGLAIPSNLAEKFSTFTDWCIHRESLPPESQRTVTALLQVTETADCQQANTVLGKLERLDLSDRQLSDLAPLSSLTQLTHLNLENNQLSDLTPLRSLTQLTHLNLKNNPLFDLSPLEKLEKLQVLDL